MSETQHENASETADFDKNLQKTAVFATKDDGNDTREKLWTDCEDLIRRIQGRFFSGRDETALRDQFAELLDRQEAITERECREYENELRNQHHKRIAELQGKLDEMKRTHMPLPVDADGMPIRPGDYMALGDSRGEVKALSYAPYNELPWQMQLDDYEWYEVVNARHTKPDTVESLLADFQRDTLTTQGEYAGEVIDVDEWERDLGGLVADYAERIRKAVEHG